ncbi:hypothetical protein LINGRAHAP2_LOCUS7497 [Linum grandiflorum]
MEFPTILMKTSRPNSVQNQPNYAKTLQHAVFYSCWKFYGLLWNALVFWA